MTSSTCRPLAATSVATRIVVPPLLNSPKKIIEKKYIIETIRINLEFFSSVLKNQLKSIYHQSYMYDGGA